jgi:hypothetical protein
MTTINSPLALLRTALACGGGRFNRKLTTEKISLVALAVICVQFVSYSQESKANQPQTVGVNHSSADTQEDRVLADRLIQEARPLNTRDAIARVKAAIVAAPMYHPPWRALQQITDEITNVEEFVKCWDDMEKAYPTNAFCLAYHAEALYGHHKLEVGKYGDEVQKAKSLAPDDPFVSFYSIQALGTMGQYNSALREIKTFKDSGGNEKVNNIISLYELTFLSLNRQFHRSNLPDASWQMPSTFEIDLHILDNNINPWLPTLCQANLSSKGFILGRQLVPDYQPGRFSEPKRWSFGGSQENPFPYAPGFFIWDGSVIAVSGYGVLVANGTHLKYVQTLNGVTTSRLGMVKDWQFVFEKENK